MFSNMKEIVGHAFLHTTMIAHKITEHEIKHTNAAKIFFTVKNPRIVSNGRKITRNIRNPHSNQDISAFLKTLKFIICYYNPELHNLCDHFKTSSSVSPNRYAPAEHTSICSHPMPAPAKHRPFFMEFTSP